LERSQSDSTSSSSLVGVRTQDPGPSRAASEQYSILWDLFRLKANGGRHRHYPQFGWDRATGLPRTALKITRSYAHNHYQSIHGGNGDITKELRQHWRDIFRIVYERVPRPDYTVVWIEFVDGYWAAHPENGEAMDALLELQRFLKEWYQDNKPYLGLQDIDVAWLFWAKKQKQTPIVLRMEWHPGLNDHLLQDPSAQFSESARNNVIEANPFLDYDDGFSDPSRRPLKIRMKPNDKTKSNEGNDHALARWEERSRLVIGTKPSDEINGKEKDHYALARWEERSRVLGLKRARVQDENDYPGQGH